MRKIFVKNKHVVYFNSLEDLEKKLNFYKQNQNKAFLISKNGNLHFNRYHTSTERIKKFKKIINKIIN